MFARAGLPLCFAFWGLALAQQPQSWTSRDKLALTYYFYWYDAHTGQHFGDHPINRLTLHPPDSYLSTYSKTDVIFHQRELSDMAAAGIDVALPVYWGDSGNVSEWSVPGLQVMVQAELAMAQAGQAAPKIGMFFDTTSLMTANNGVRPDLTTAAGKSLFYGMIHQFFTVVPRQFWAMIDGRPIVVLYFSQYAAAYDQTSFDYVGQQFQSDFGVAPYIIRERSWKNVVTDAAYSWGAAISGPIIIGDVAAIGPGFDNLAVAEAQGHHTVKDRSCGDFYQREWHRVISRGARLVLIETWNELHEGTGISATKEYGRRYINFTAGNAARWKASTSSPPDMVWASLGPQVYESGLNPALNAGDGTWLTTRIAGHDAIYTDRFGTSPGYYIYLAADDRVLPTKPSGVWVTVEYLDTGNTPWRLEYDGAGNPYTATAVVSPQNTSLWKLQTFYLPDATFQKRENGASDLRIDDYNTQGVVHYFNRVWITKSQPSGQPPQLSPVPDVVVLAGSSVDVPLSALDSSGTPLPFSLAMGPGFASLNGNTAAQSVRLAPTFDDAVCADVTGPGVTSSPFYSVAAVVNDPNSQPPSGAAAFHVTVTLPPPAVGAGGVVNNASYTLAGATVAPGAIAAVFGTNLTDGTSCVPPSCNPTFESGKLTTTMAGAQVMINGAPVPMFYATPGQLGIQIPAELSAGSATIQVVNRSQTSTSLPVVVDAVSPGIFSFSADGKGAGAITHASGTPVSPQKPAQPGEVVVIYATGLGQISPFVATGALPAAVSSTVSKVTVTIDGTAVAPAFAGLAGCCVGLNQINVKIPAATRSGDNIPVFLSIAGKQSNTVTLAVSSR